MWLQLASLVLPLAACFCFYCKRKYSYFKERGVRHLPPVPIFGNFMKSLFLKRHVIDDIDDIYSAFPDDKYVGAYESFTPVVLIRDPEIIKNITVKDFEYFADHRGFFSVDHDSLLSGSMLFMKGQRWRDMRATLSPGFTGSKMRHMVPFINEIAAQIMDYLYQEVKINKEGESSSEVDMFDLFTRYANDVIASCAFGFKVNSVKEKNNDFFKMGQFSTQFSMSQRIKFFLITMCPKITKMLKVNLFSKKTNDFFHNIVFSTMKYREENNVSRLDMIQLLMEANNGNEKLKNASPLTDDRLILPNVKDSKVLQNAVNSKWSPDEIAGQAFFFFFAGFESSASSLTLAAHELALNPEVQNKLREEVDECHASNPQLTYEVLQNLKYMDMVINETLRKWSTAIIMGRECLKEYTLEPSRPGAPPLTLKPKDYVFALVNALQMDKKYFPDPHKFDPERFSEERKQNIKPFTYMPFGVGPRNCIGYRFVKLELKVVLYQLLLEFELVSCSRTTNPIRLQPLDFNVRVANGSWLRLRARNHPSSRHKRE